MHTGNIPYLDFIAPGILAQSVLFVAIFYGINVIWERDLGIVQKFLASPTPRAALVLGKGFSAGIRTLSQAVVVYGLSLLLGVKLNWSPIALLNVLVIVVLAATLFSTFSLIIACIVKTRERFMGVGQVLTMPLFFASNAIYPTAIMPGWLKIVSHLNPLTYVVDALRTCMLKGSASSFGLSRDYAVIFVTTTILIFYWCAIVSPTCVVNPLREVRRSGASDLSGKCATRREVVPRPLYVASLMNFLRPDRTTD